MEIEEISTSVEKRLCWLLATNDSFADEVADRYQKGMFDSTYCASLANLCIAYYKKFKEAPKSNLAKFFSNAVALKKLSPEKASEIQILIQGFVSETEVHDIDFEIAEALRYLKKQEIKLVSEEANELLESGKVDEAQELLAKVEAFENGKLDGCDMYSLDDGAIDSAVNDTYEQLIEMPGACGKIMNNTLVRGGFITFIARMKAGKSFWMLELAKQARNQGRRVIFFSAGDMTKNQVLIRLWNNDARTTNNKWYLKNQRMPYLDCVKNQKGICFDSESDGDLLNEFKEVDPYIVDDKYKPCTKCLYCADTKKKYEKAISYKQLCRPLLDSELVRKMRDKWVESGNQGVLHIEHAPSGTLTCAERRSRIRKICKKYGWEHPDVIVYDYAGLLANEKKDERESTHYIWQSLRAEADPEMLDCLVITAMQANSTSFDFEDLSIRSFSLDKRCFDEVSGAFALNQTPEERKEGITRIAALLKREHAFDESMQAECHGCLSLGTPLLASTIVYKDPPKPKFSK